MDSLFSIYMMLKWKFYIFHILNSANLVALYTFEQ